MKDDFEIGDEVLIKGDGELKGGVISKITKKFVTIKYVDRQGLGAGMMSVYKDRIKRDDDGVVVALLI